MCFNKQFDKGIAKGVINNIKNILKSWIPHTIDYKEKKERGWYRVYKQGNEYIKEYMTVYGEKHINQYHDAWSRCPYKKELVDYVKTLGEDCLKVFTKITGITCEDLVEITIEGKTKRISRLSAKELGLI